MNADRPERRTLLAAAASSVVGAAVCTIVLLYANPHGASRVAAGLVVAVLVVGVAAGTYLQRRAASGALESSRLDSSLQPPVPTYQPPRKTSDDYWYPAAATRDRTGTRARGPGL